MKKFNGMNAFYHDAVHGKKTEGGTPLITSRTFQRGVRCVLMVFLFIGACSGGLLAQTTYPTLQFINRPSPEPTPPGDSFSPPVSGTAASNTPAFAEWTRTAGPDETIVATGINFSRYSGTQEGKDTRYLIYSNGELSQKVNLQRVDDNKAIITIDKTIPNWSMYLLWPGNEVGYGTPVAINQTDAWWLGPDKATRGKTVSVYGRNLAHNNGTSSSNVYIRAADGTGQWTTVTKVNPYKVDFIVPSNIGNGNYEIWTHNGHGGSYGWSGPLTLTVTDGAQWNGNVFNVKDYGAAGNGSRDDTQSILNAINACTPNSTVYFPGGVYMVSKTIPIKDNIRLDGDGRDNSIIRLANNFNDPDGGGIIDAYRLTNIEIKEMGFDANHEYTGRDVSTPLMFLRESDDVVVDNCRFSFQGYQTFDLHETSYITIKNSDIIGILMFMGTSHQTFIDGCAFKLTNDTRMGIHSWGGVGVSVSNSTCSDYNNSNVNDGAGWGEGRFFVGLGIWGSSRWTYLGNNTTTDLTVRPGVADQNTGEQFMWEGNNTIYSGSPSSATATTITLNGFSPSNEISRHAMIVKGRGMGQSRRIVSHNGSTYTLDVPWNIIPDGTSVINIGNYSDRVAIYGNYLDGKSRANSSESTGSIGIEPFSGNSNYVVDNNTLSQLRYGTSNWGIRFDDYSAITPNFFILYANNKYLNCRWAISNVFQDYDDGDLNGIGVLGTIYRKNDIQNPVVAAIANPVTVTIRNPILEGIIYEHNSMTNVPQVYESSPDFVQAMGNQLMYGNIFNRGSASSSSPAIDVMPRMIFRDNSYSGYGKNYADVLPNVIEAPKHAIEMSGTPNGNVVTATLTIYNAGVTAMNWTASDNAGWLTLSTQNGSIQDEGGQSTITLSANPAGLGTGRQIADITVTAGGVTEIYSVNFTLGSGSSNQSPVANAGSDQTITLPNSSVTLNGSGSDPDGYITGYAWTKISGPSVGNITSPTSASTSVVNLTQQGIYVFRLTVADNNSQGAAVATDDITVTVNPGSGAPPITGTLRINSGGPQVNTSMGVFNADAYFSPNPGNLFSVNSPIAGTSDDALYQTERYGGSQTLNYALPVANGSYTVVLHFAEIFFTGAGQRVFDISMEGTKVKDNFDIVAKAGAMTATTETFQVNVSDGTLNIYFSSLAADGGRDNPAVTAIEVQPAGGGTPSGAIRINAGGPQISNSIGVFAADNYFSPNPGNKYSVSTPINGTNDDALYQTETYGTNGVFSYNIPVANGSYTVVLHFAEVYHTTVNSRVFDISMEGSRVKDNFDIVAKVGANTATTETFQVNVNDGVLNMYFSALAADGGKDQPKVSGIEILPAGSTPATLVRINAAGEQLNTTLGVFAADAYFSPSYEYSTTSAIAGTTNDALYMTERYSTEGNGSFSYAVPVSNGNYNVTLHFAEIYHTAINRRKFDVTMEGVLKLDNYDVFAKVGANTATTETFTVTVTDGILNILFDAGVNVGGIDRPKVSAIEIISAGATGALAAGSANTLSITTTEQKLSMKVSPNPSNHYFVLSVKSGSQQKASLQVFDAVGQLIETRNNLDTNNTLRFGNTYRPGIYYVEIRQGNERQVTKLVKQ